MGTCVCEEVLYCITVYACTVLCIVTLVQLASCRLSKVAMCATRAVDVSSLIPGP